MAKHQFLTDAQGRSGKLQVRDLSVHYDGLAAVRGVSFDVSPGEVLGILGPSGAGKSSILAALTGVVPATGGIRYGERDLSSSQPQDRQFSNVYQEFRLFDWATVTGNVAFPCRARGWPAERIRERVAWALDRMHLSGLADRGVRTLSGGERQRVALARAVACSPRALFLDEPFSDLDVPLRLRLRQDLKDYLTEADIPVILVTHDRNEAFALCDRVAVLLAGKIRQIGRPDRLLRNPIDTETAIFLGYSNEMAGQVLGVDGERVRVSAAGREWLATPPGNPSTSDWTPGSAVTLLFRPISLVPQRAETNGPNQCEVIVRAVHEMEHYRLVALDGPEGLASHGHWPLTIPSPAIGQPVRCAVRAGELRVFAGAE